QGLSPVLDVVRDYRWGRVEETMGEDPHLVSVLGAPCVRGLQSAGVIATLKHFAGYSAARAGRNHGPVPMGRRELMDVILPSFETAVALAGAGSVMNSYSDVDGVPAGADHWLLTDLLREEWGFAGSVVSDYWAVPFLATMHRIAADADEAGAHPIAGGRGRARGQGPRRRHRRRAAGHSRLRPRPPGAGPAGRAARGPRRPGRPQAPDAEGAAGAARRRLDAGRVGGRCGRRRPRRAGQPRPGQGDGRAVGRPARGRVGAAAARRRAAGAAAGGRRRALRRGPAG